MTTNTYPSLFTKRRAAESRESAPPHPIAAQLVNTGMSFDGHAILSDVSLTVRRGETLVIIGESGCGKSVTTKLLAGLLEPTSGDVLWQGRPVRSRNRVEMQRDRLKLGYLFQGAALFDSMDVYENVAFGLRENTRLRESEIAGIVHDRLREVGLSDADDRKRPADLSGGMKKRVGLARALAMSPDMIFYDEPTTGLDPVMSGMIDDLIIQTQQRRQVTSIVVTHDMNTVRRAADRVVMLYPLRKLRTGESQVVFEGSREELFATDNLRVAQFIRGDVRYSG